MEPALRGNFQGGGRNRKFFLGPLSQERLTATRETETQGRKEPIRAKVWPNWEEGGTRSLTPGREIWDWGTHWVRGKGGLSRGVNGPRKWGGRRNPKTPKGGLSRGRKGGHLPGATRAFLILSPPKTGKGLGKQSRIFPPFPQFQLNPIPLEGKDLITPNFPLGYNFKPTKEKPTPLGGHWTSPPAKGVKGTRKRVTVKGPVVHRANIRKKKGVLKKFFSPPMFGLPKRLGIPPFRYMLYPV